MITVGMDEVGRGCWAGPLVVGAVILPDYPPKLHLERGSVLLRDSKKLSKKQRKQSAAWVYANAVAVGLGWVTAAEIDKWGLSEAVRQGYVRALAGITTEYDEVIIDGNLNFLAADPKTRTIVKADDSVPAVSAASIVAKVARDTYMAALSERYAGYGFEKHVGYGTAAHRAALQTLGVTELHRQSYKPIQLLLNRT